MVGGALWLLLWVHFLLTHGPTTSDHNNTFLGMSYYDSTKLTAFAIALCIAGLTSLRIQRPGRPSSRMTVWGHFVAVAAMLVMMVGVEVSVWSVPWGETTRTATTLEDYGFVAMMIATLFAFVGLMLLGIGVARTKVLPAWTIVPLAIAGLAAVPWIHHTVYGALIALGWIAVGYSIWRSDAEAGMASRR